MGWDMSTDDCGSASVTAEGGTSRFREDEGLNVAVLFAPFAVDGLEK